MFSLFFGNKSTINEKSLEQNGVKILNKHDLKIDKTHCIAVTGSGKFYKGLFKNEAVTIKVIYIYIII